MTDRKLFGFEEVGDRWGVSLWTVRRAVDRGDLKAVNIGTRRLISLGEIERVEKDGLGGGRKRRSGQEKGSGPEATNETVAITNKEDLRRELLPPLIQDDLYKAKPNGRL